MATVHTIGIEEEYQVIDPESRELRSHMSKIIEGGQTVLREQVKAEMHQSVVEVGTLVCQDIEQARDEVARLRRTVIGLAENNGYQIAAAGTHPFSKWEQQLITEDPRYNEIVQELQDTARGNLIFGMHVHVGIENRESGLQVMNAARYFLPHIFALSTNSPFWEGRNTGFKSFRTKVFDKFPRTGIPEYFSSAREYDSFVELLVKTGCIDNGKKIWWDIRLHPFYPTLEFRICDVPMRLEETVALAAVMQAIIAKLYKLMKNNLNFRLYRRSLINENKWRAARYGLEGRLIDFGKEAEVETRTLIEELLEFIDDVVDELGSRWAIEYIHRIMEEGSGADRQLQVWQHTGQMPTVVDYIVGQTKSGL